jgi:hypothetical protein
MHPVDDKHPDRVAMLLGTQMMVALNPPDYLKDQALRLPGTPRPVSHQPSVFTIATAGGPVTMAPFYQVRDETYTTYLRQETK